MAAASALLAGFGPGALGATPASAPSPDTEATPVAKDGCQVGWQQVAGDVLSAAPCDAYKPDPAGVPFSVDFFAARFSSESNGYAGGAECISASGDPAGCARTPVLYHYVGATRRWAKVPLPAGGPGFIGALAYIDRDTMLAVGGDGSYPRREPAAGAADPAGGARVWVIRGGSACELGNGSSCGSLRDGMRGLTAVDCSPDGSGFCVAGGYRQLWMWRDGRFVANYDDSAGQPGFPGAASFLFRVRAVRFNPDPKDSSVPQVSAATSGCCDANPANDAGAIFGYDGSTWSPQGFLAATGSTPESFYALTITPASASGPAAFSVLATPGGSPAVGGSPEPNSRIISSNSGVGNSGQNAFNPLYFAQGPDLLGEFAPRVSGLRLLSGDGDLTGRSEIGVVDSLAGGAPDGFMDWAVGVQTASGQGMAYTTTQRGTFKPSPFSCPIEVTSVAGGVTNPFYTACRPDATGAITQTQARSVYALPSYGLNSFTMLPTGVGWAVGDRGGILRLGGEDSAASTTQDSSLPSLGGHKPGALSDGAPYDGYRPLPSSSQLGHVPALDSRALLRPAAAQWVAAGSPDPNRETEFLPRNQQVTSIVMSRDGSEGWAVGGPSGGDIGYQFQVTTLYHYVGGRWSSCDPDGIAGVSAPDPACASLAGLRRYKAADGAVRPVNLLGAARIPTESGSDPSRAGDFEVVAVGTKYRFGTGPEMDTVLRYAHGRWSFDHDAMSGIDP
ncbi:MAG TPA: hypothetical protein VGN69_08460, partial [Solirubrobacteraceae bacterium]|nr:hypothetical protein [Solirubrobacteraceae bacterium]